MSDSEGQEIVACSECGAEYERESYCGECGSGREMGERVVDKAPAEPERVNARAIQPRTLPVREPAWCPYCVAWLGAFSSKEDARAYERSLVRHPFEFCAKRIAKLSGSEEWRLRHEAAKWGSLAVAKPGSPRVPSKGAGA